MALLPSVDHDRSALRMAAERSGPTRGQALLFVAKAWCFRARRWLSERKGARPRRLGRSHAEGMTCLAESRSPLYASAVPEELALQAGKVQNLRVAARALNGAFLPAGEVFSFWANVPRPTRARGFAPGRELREGCVIPSVGGGLCQLSNALYDAALRAGFEIVERHAHSRTLPGSMAATGRDATIFWNYVDLRFRAPGDVRIEVKLDADECVVRFHGRSAGSPAMPVLKPSPGPLAESCETCGMVSCFRNAAATGLAREDFSAWLADAFQPELSEWMMRERAPRDWLFLPLDSRRFHVGPYRWSTSGFAVVREARWTTLRRSFASRRLAQQGAQRQRALLGMDAAMAAAFSRKVPALAAHLVISQNLLPFLWQNGDLGGRTFDVMMTRLPLAEMERTLDRAAKAHPGSLTLADFRAPREIIAAEAEALAAAQEWITPHAAIARLGGDKAVRLPWKLPLVPRAERGKWIVFPASTLGRKGAYELRSVARELKLPVRLCGPVIEAADFWAGVETELAGADWLAGARAVVLPAWVENQPRRLLAAVAAGVPVIAAEACGLEGVAGVTTVPTGDVAALRAALLAL